MGNSWSGCCVRFLRVTQPIVQGACQASVPGPSTFGPTRLLAPLWHTHALVALMLAVAAAGTVIGQSPPAIATATPAPWSSYLPLTIVSAGLAVYVCRLGLQRNILADLCKLGRYDVRRALADVAIAGTLVTLIILAENGLQTRFGMPESTAAHALLPTTVGAKLAWLGAAALVGLSEELVYRGYLQRQLSALSGLVPCGIVAQALLFGIAHGEQGAWAVARFALYAVLLGWVVAARRSLLPSILCHVALDWYAALSV